MKFGKFTPWDEWAKVSEFHFENGYGSIVIRGPQGLYKLEVLNETAFTLVTGISRLIRRLQATSWRTWKLTTS